MEAQLVHRAEDGKQAIVSVLLEKGDENPVIQAALNNFPLEKGGETALPGQSVDLNFLLPIDRGYFIFMGSLTTPPCSEDVLWMVLKQPQQVSAEQLTMFRRLYRPNARPVQPVFGRIIKGSR
jgi:carbonic anhydrase